MGTSSKYLSNGGLRVECSDTHDGFLEMSPADVNDIVNEYELYQIMQDISRMTEDDGFTPKEIRVMAKRVMEDEAEARMLHDTYWRFIEDSVLDFKERQRNGGL
ncbi:hypothetical protein AGMMS49975_14740 [Clostridia bacterium]|nr:hypothetical protein AGMMS49975_14740 [Clostridia bacterium]